MAGGKEVELCIESEPSNRFVVVSGPFGYYVTLFDYSNDAIGSTNAN